VQFSIRLQICQQPVTVSSTALVTSLDPHGFSQTFFLHLCGLIHNALPMCSSSAPNMPPPQKLVFFLNFFLPTHLRNVMHRTYNQRPRSFSVVELVPQEHKGPRTPAFASLTCVINFSPSQIEFLPRDLAQFPPPPPPFGQTPCIFCLSYHTADCFSALQSPRPRRCRAVFKILFCLEPPSFVPDGHQLYRKSIHLGPMMEFGFSGMYSVFIPSPPVPLAGPFPRSALFSVLLWISARNDPPLPHLLY